MTWKPLYASAEDLKTFLNINVSNSVDDAFLALAVESSSRSIDVACNRQFGKVAVAEQRFYTAAWDRTRCRWVVPIDDLMSATGLAAVTLDSDGNEVGEIDDYVLEPRNAAQTGRPWTRMMVRPNSAQVPTGATDEVAITASWGWTAVPDAIKQACLLQGSRFHHRRESPYGIAGSPDVGSELRLLARLDPDVAVMVGPFRRWWGAA
jgi:hypothetical protein